MTYTITTEKLQEAKGRTLKFLNKHLPNFDREVDLAQDSSSDIEHQVQRLYEQISKVVELADRLQIINTQLLKGNRLWVGSGACLRVHDKPITITPKKGKPRTPSRVVLCSLQDKEGERQFEVTAFRHHFQTVAKRIIKNSHKIYIEPYSPEITESFDRELEKTGWRPAELVWSNH